MKTAREILFQRHQAAESQLDGIRRDVLAKMGSARADRQEARPTLGEIFLSLRWHWAALAAAWLMVAVLNHEPWRGERSVAHGRGAADTREVVLALRESRRQLLDLIGPTTAEAAPAPSKQAPRPRSKFESPRRPV